MMAKTTVPVKTSGFKYLTTRRLPGTFTFFHALKNYVNGVKYISLRSVSSAEEQLARRRVRPARLALLKSEMRRQLRQLSKSQALSIEHSRDSFTSHRNLLLRLTQASKLSAKKTVDLLIKRRTPASSYYEQLTSSKPKRWFVSSFIFILS